MTRLVSGEWTEGRAVHADGWETGACPVNGPSVAARGDDVVVAWFTAAGGVPRVNVAFSGNAGRSFGEPVGVDSGDPAGRVDVLLLEDGAALVTWLERTGGEFAEVRMRHVSQGGRLGDPVSVRSSSSGRASGFPRMVEMPEGRVLLAWTDAERTLPQVRLAVVELVKE
jgi:hypothetical protein